MLESELMKASDNIRILSASMVQKAKSGHPGGAMGAAEFMAVLYGEFLKFAPKNPKWIARDRFFLDPGHMSPLLYSTLSLIDKIPVENLSEFRQWESVVPGHPEVDVLRGIENTSGPLGQGHAMAMGSAIAERFLAARFGKVVEHKTVSLISDGGIQEEISAGVGRLAGHLGLHNLILYYDSNGIQLSTETKAVTSEDVARKYRAWGWKVLGIDGNDPLAIRRALSEAWKETEAPTIIIGNSVMGKGCRTEDGELFEGKLSVHGQPLDAAGANTDESVRQMGGDPSQPFQIFEEVQKAFQTRLHENQEVFENWENEFQKWKLENPGKSSRLDQFFSNTAPDMDWDKVVQKEGAASRSSSGQVLKEVAKQMDNVICCSADLANSDQTIQFLNETKAFSKGDFEGSFFQAGVAELTMAAACNGMALHGGVVPMCATFFIFSEYMKPAVRMAALMELPVKYIWTHDSFRVGEDGPTHQPIEQEAQIRLMEKVHNFAGKPSMLVFRPADAEETTASWKSAFANTKSPSALILSRQNLPGLPPMKTSRKEEVAQVKNGGYIVYESKAQNHSNWDLIFVANGSDVALCIESAQILAKEGKSVRVIDVVSEGLFRMQSKEYQESLLPEFAPIFGVTSGLSFGLNDLTGEFGEAFGLNHFGASAPAGVLDEKFGFTTENVLKESKLYMMRYGEKVARFR